MVNKNTKKNNRKRVVKTNNEAEKPYRFRLGFDQSVSSGVINIHGECYFNYDIADAENSLQFLRINLQRFESDLTREGYLVASKHAPKRNGNGGGVNKKDD
jgi:protein involved in sex pheromone biosynthesis